LWSLGVVLVLHFTIVLAVKIFWLITIPELDLISNNYLTGDSVNRSFEPIRTFFGTRL
jgi:hypothetical protein